MSELREKTCLIIGGGKAPKIVIEQLKKDREDFFVIALKGHADPSSIRKDTNHSWIELGQLKKAFDLLKKNNISRVSFIGSVKRPSLSNIKTDIEGSLFLLKMGFKKFVGGDNSLLSGVLNLFEEKGFDVISSSTISPSLKAPRGVLGKIKPKKQDIKDIEIGTRILEQTGKTDIGQSLIIEKGYILGIEAAEGTQNLIKRCKPLKREQDRCGVLVKIKKQNQDPRIDLPSIGPKTIDAIKSSGFRGIAIQSEYGLIIEKEKLIKKANENNIFVVGI